MDSNNAAVPPPPPSGTATSGPNSSCQILPPLSIGSGNYDRAWNDPPVFSLEVNGMAKPVPTKLNKRLAYPGLSSTTGSAAASIPYGGPTPPLPQPLLPPPMIHPVLSVPPTRVDFIPSFPSPVSSPDEATPPSSVSGSSCSRNENKDFVGSKARLMNLLEDCLKDGIPLEPTVEVEVGKRLDVLTHMWDELDEDCKQKLTELANYLEVRDYRKAEALQVSLDADSMDQSVSWNMAMMAIKQIIQKNLH